MHRVRQADAVHGQVSFIFIQEINVKFRCLRITILVDLSSFINKRVARR